MSVGAQMMSVTGKLTSVGVQMMLVAVWDRPPGGCEGGGGKGWKKLGLSLKKNLGQGDGFNWGFVGAGGGGALSVERNCGCP